MSTLPDVKLGAVTLRQTRDFPVTPITPPIPVKELSSAQQARKDRQQRFLSAYATLETLFQEIQEFSVGHHYFKSTTKARWVSLATEALEGMRVFVPRNLSQQESQEQQESDDSQITSEELSNASES